MEIENQSENLGNCPSCKVPIQPGLEQCHSCSYPFNASEEAKNAFRKGRRKLVTEWYGYDMKVERTGTLLIIMGILGMVQVGIQFYFYPYLLTYRLIPWMAFTVTMILALSMMYIATGILGRKFGLVPILIGSSLYGLEFLLRFFLRPIDLWHIPRIMLLFFLIAGLIQAINSERAKKRIEFELGPGFNHYLDKENR